MELRSFYLITPLNFEASVAAACAEAWPFLQAPPKAPVLEPPAMLIEDGGVSFTAPLSLGLQLNFWARGAVRILLRVAQFPARSLRELRAQLEKLDLSGFGRIKTIKISVTVKKSKMSHSGAVKESVDRLFARLGYDVVNEDSAGLHLFIRVFRDECQISVDTSGPPLFYRGYKTMTTAAPLRENLAYLLLREMVQSYEGQAWPYPDLIDPMAGSGSFIFEAANYFHPLYYARTFSFQTWLSCPDFLKPDQLVRGDYRSPFGTLSAMDQDERALMAFRANREALLSHCRFAEIDEIKKRDHFGSDKGADHGPRSATRGATRWVISNPPYNHRIGIDRSEQDFYSEILASASRRYDPELCALLLPSRVKAIGLRTPEHWKLIRRKNFKNGGLAVQFIIWARDRG